MTLDHSLEIVEINLNKNEIASERKIAFIDINRDLYLSPVHKRDLVIHFISYILYINNFKLKKIERRSN